MLLLKPKNALKSSRCLYLLAWLGVGSSGSWLMAPSSSGGMPTWRRRGSPTRRGLQQAHAPTQPLWPTQSSLQALIEGFDAQRPTAGAHAHAQPRWPNQSA